MSGIGRELAGTDGVLLVQEPAFGQRLAGLAKTSLADTGKDKELASRHTQRDNDFLYNMSIRMSIVERRLAARPPWTLGWSPMNAT